MKRKSNLLEKLKKLSYFDNKTIHSLGKSLDLETNSIKTYISRFLKYKEIIQLKNGLYISSEFFYNNKKDISYYFYLSNVLYPPSYISSWTALQYYNLTTESIYPMTAVSSKTSRNFENKIGTFSYNSIKKDLFNDFVLKGDKFKFYIASPAKALFDLIYFKTKQFKGLTLSDIEKIIDDLRIDFSEMEEEEKEKFYNLVNKFI